MFTFNPNKLVLILLIPVFLLVLFATKAWVLPDSVYFSLIAFVSLMIGGWVTYTLLKTKIDRLTQLSNTDTTTGLYSSETVEKLLNHEVERSRRYKRDISMILLSVDDLAIITENYGKQKTEKVLKLLSRIILKGIKYTDHEEKEFHGIRSSDIAFRYKDEGKILIVMPETSAKGAFIAAERIREAVMYTPFEKISADEDLRITLSSGVVSLDLEHDTAETLLQRANLLLRKAKITYNHVVIENPIHHGLVLFAKTKPSC